MNERQGYLVVLRYREHLLPLKPRYRGLTRLPIYPSKEPTEHAAMEDYVFGDYMGDRSLIPDLVLARELLFRLRKSPRRFEIIYFRPADEPSDDPRESECHFLGFDVADGPAFWSILGEYIPPELSAVTGRLNENGLLATVDEAREYPDAYRAARFAHYEWPLAPGLCSLWMVDSWARPPEQGGGRNQD